MLCAICGGAVMDTRENIDEETYEWLTQRFGERVAEALIPCPGHAWPLTQDEQTSAHRHYKLWIEQQEEPCVH